MRRAVAALALCAALAAPAAAREASWLDRFNRTMHETNGRARNAMAGLARHLPYAPTLPNGMRGGAGNLIIT
jgi:hypothetical protein